MTSAHAFPSCIVVGAALVVAASAAPAQTLIVEPRDCATGVHLAVRDAPLAQVLRRLADTLGFELRDEVQSSASVNVDLTREPGILLTKLLGQQPVMVRETRDPACPGRRKIVSLWILPVGAKNAAVAAPRPAPALPPPTPRELDEESRRAKQAYDTYYRAHGTAPPGLDEEITK